AASQPEEEVGVLVVVRGDELAVGGHDVARTKRVDRETELAHEVADAATERQSPDAGVADDSPRRGETEGLRFAVEVLIQAAARDTHRARHRVDARPGHRRE